jgi:ribonuclease VapC
MFLDASVIIANLLEEPEAPAIRMMLSEEGDLTTSPLAIFEASTRLAVVRDLTVDEAYKVICAFVEGARVGLHAIDAEVGRAAHACASRYHHLTGHPARLNMGDCFAFAAARAAGLKLAYKGNDFSRTDIEGVRFGPESAPAVA